MTSNKTVDTDRIEAVLLDMESVLTMLIRKIDIMKKLFPGIAFNDFDLLIRVQNQLIDEIRGEIIEDDPEDD